MFLPVEDGGAGSCLPVSRFSTTSGGISRVIPITAPIPRPVRICALYMVVGIVPSSGRTQNHARPPVCRIGNEKDTYTSYTLFGDETVNNKACEGYEYVEGNQSYCSSQWRCSSHILVALRNIDDENVIRHTREERESTNHINGPSYWFLESSSTHSSVPIQGLLCMNRQGKIGSKVRWDLVKNHSYQRKAIHITPDTVSPCWVLILLITLMWKTSWQNHPKKEDCGSSEWKT